MDRCRLFVRQHDPGPVTVAAYGFQVPAVIDHDIMQLNWVPLLTDRAFARRHFFLPVRVQVLCFPFMVPVDTAVCKLLAGFLSAVPAVNVFCIIKLFQNMVVAAFLLAEPPALPCASDGIFPSRKHHSHGFCRCSVSGEILLLLPHK